MYNVYTCTVVCGHIFLQSHKAKGLLDLKQCQAFAVDPTLYGRYGIGYNPCVSYMYMLHADREFAPTADFLAQTVDPRSAQQSKDSADNPWIVLCKPNVFEACHN